MMMAQAIAVARIIRAAMRFAWFGTKLLAAGVGNLLVTPTPSIVFRFDVIAENGHEAKLVFFSGKHDFDAIFLDEPDDDLLGFRLGLHYGADDGRHRGSVDEEFVDAWRSSSCLAMNFD
jgi:hypothetical protein